MSTLDRMLAQMLPYVPRKIVGRVSARYIAGARLEDALNTVARLASEDLRVTVDHLGEFVTDLAEAKRAVAHYLELLAAINSHGLDSQASVKLTQLGLLIDSDSCLQHMRTLVQSAEKHRTLITIDMEDSSCTDDTLDIFEVLRNESSNVGSVLQACLRRSRSDLERLLPLVPNVRICKGIYVEPPEIAYTEREQIRRNFLELVEAMLQRPSFVGIATHDDVLLDASCDLLQKYSATHEQYEFQMLLGVREDLRRKLRQLNHPVRIYVPYGEHWYAYSMRRLKENPEIAGHIFRNLFERN